jgi:hypothetical protein
MPVKNLTPTYTTWVQMRNRCNNPKNDAYAAYGGAGIRVCERWNSSYANFLADMGERPAGKTIDRINSSGNYEPGNCRWATPAEQTRNRRVPIVTPEIADEIRALRSTGMSAVEIAERVGFIKQTVWMVLSGKHWTSRAAKETR